MTHKPIYQLRIALLTLLTVTSIVGIAAAETFYARTAHGRFSAIAAKWVTPLHIHSVAYHGVVARGVVANGEATTIDGLDDRDIALNFGEKTDLAQRA